MTIKEFEEYNKNNNFGKGIYLCFHCKKFIESDEYADSISIEQRMRYVGHAAQYGFTFFHYPCFIVVAGTHYIIEDNHDKT
jgi:hypothetical protein